VLKKVGCGCFDVRGGSSGVVVHPMREHGTLHLDATKIDRAENGSPQVQEVAKVVMEKSNPQPRNRASRRTEVEHDAARLRYIHIPQASMDVPDEAPHEETTLEDAFNDSHRRFEDVLMERRAEGHDWRAEITSLIQSNLSDNKGYNVLLVASDFADDALTRDVLERVLHEKPNLVNRVNVFGNSALHYAAVNDRTSLVKYLIKKGADPRMANVRGQTAFHLAAREHNTNVLKMLLRYVSSSQVVAKDDFGQTALHLACCCYTSAEVIQELLDAGAQSNSTDCEGNTPLDLNAKFGDPEAWDVLLAHVDADGIADSVPPPPYQSTVSLPQPSKSIVPDCSCETCLLIGAVRNISDERAVVDVCSCPYHLRLLCQDTLSDIEAVTSGFKNCDCQFCTSGRDLNSNQEPCLPLPVCECPECLEAREDSTSSNSSYTDPPTRPFGEDFSGAPYPPYPGHEYYDYLIEEVLTSSEAGLSDQEL
jgi:hypothetical protein